MRVGNGPVTVLGNTGAAAIQGSGELMLGVNDDHFPDNSGEYDVTLSVRR